MDTFKYESGQVLYFVQAPLVKLVIPTRVASQAFP